MLACYAYTYEAIYYRLGRFEQLCITVVLESSADDIFDVSLESFDLFVSSGFGTGFVIRVPERLVITSAPIEYVELVPGYASAFPNDWADSKVAEELFYLNGPLIISPVFFVGLYNGSSLDILSLVRLGV